MSNEELSAAEEPQFFLELVTTPTLAFQATLPDGKIYRRPVTTAQAQSVAMWILGATGTDLLPENAKMLMLSAEEQCKRRVSEMLARVRVVEI